MKVAIYIRVASQDQISAELQEAAMRQYAEEEGYEVAAVFPLIGISGLNTRCYLEELIDMMNDMGISKVIARDPSRISRDPFQFFALDELFRKNSLELEYIPSLSISPELSGEEMNILRFLMDELGMDA